MRKKIIFEADGQREEIIEEGGLHGNKKVKSELNFINGEPYSENYHKLLATRMKLPAY